MVRSTSLLLSTRILPTCPTSATSRYLHIYPLLRVHHGVVAHFQALEDLHVLDVEAGEVLKRLHNGSLRRRRWWIVSFCHIQGVVLDVHLRTCVRACVRVDAFGCETYTHPVHKRTNELPKYITPTCFRGKLLRITVLNSSAYHY